MKRWSETNDILDEWRSDFKHTADLLTGTATELDERMGDLNKRLKDAMQLMQSTHDILEVNLQRFNASAESAVKLGYNVCGIGTLFGTTRVTLDCMHHPVWKGSRYGIPFGLGLFAVGSWTSYGLLRYPSEHFDAYGARFISIANASTPSVLNDVVRAFTYPKDDKELHMMNCDGLYFGT